MAGIKAFIKRGAAKGVDAAVICEPEKNQLCTRQRGALRVEASEIGSEGGEAEAIELDMTDPNSVRRAVESVGVPDVLVSTPSIEVRKPVPEITDDEFDQIVELNMKGAFRLIRDFGCWAQPRELVGMVVYLASDASSFVTGAVMLVDGGPAAIDGRSTPPL